MPIDLTQEFTFETDGLNTFERMFTVVCPILFKLAPQIPIHYGRHKAFRSDYPSHSAAWYLSLKGQVYPPPQPLHLFICAVGLWYDSVYDESIWCASYEELVVTAMRAVKSASHEQFTALAGLHGPFADAEGLKKVGYRMHLATCAGPAMSLSLCHIYYPK